MKSWTNACGQQVPKKTEAWEERKSLTFSRVERNVDIFEKREGERRGKSQSLAGRMSISGHNWRLEERV